MEAEPLVSVIMANLNGEAHIAAAVRGVLRQTLSSLELILSDDGSTDASIARAREAAAGDDRLVVIEGGPRSGPAAARNRAIARARGRWLAVVDSDDFIHPRRLETLIAAAERDGADIIADDLLVFYEDAGRRPHALLKAKWAAKPSWVTAADYVSANHLYSSRPPLGYLKPVIRTGAFPKTIRYDESLRIAEDFQLIAELLMGGAKMRIQPELLYFYRKHAGSISHRLSAADLDAMLAANERLEASARHPDAREAMRGQRDSLLTGRAFADLIDALKAGELARAATTAMRRPSALWLLRLPLLSRLSAPRKAARKRGSARSGRRVALLSRQRLVGATNGSSAYLLGLAGALRKAGFAVDFIGASPRIFGRWPLFRLRSEISVFSSYSVCGGLRTGPLVWATDPRVALRGALAAAAIALRRIFPSWSLGLKPADYAVASPPERSDLLYIARRAPAGLVAVICDYAFLNPLAPYTLAPTAPVVTIMHDLMSSRVNDDRLERLPAPREIVGLTAADEYALLALADMVIAIQGQEAREVQTHVRSALTVTAPMAAETALAPQPGKNDVLLFVGSNTAANAAGLQWFLDFCWPTVTAARPDAQLIVAGSVSRALARPPRGVQLLGVVERLDDLYRDAGVVISPLKTGSGLKIKLVEALAAGKAVVGTSVTTQGVAPVVNDAMAVADDPNAFASAVIRLASDPAERARLAAAALACAESSFSPAACYGPMIRALEAKIGSDAALADAQGQAFETPALSPAVATK